MKATIINLEHRTDRKEEVIAECDREGLGFEFINAVNGQIEFIGIIPNRRMRGHAGCQQSHINVLKKVKGSAEFHLILEDDAVLVDGFKQKTIELLTKIPSECGLVYLGGNTYNHKNSFEPYDDTFNRALRVMATHCYIVRDEHIDSILNVLESRLYKVDMILMEYQLNNLSLITTECLSWQRESYSNIVFKTTVSSPKY